MFLHRPSAAHWHFACTLVVLCRKLVVEELADIFLRTVVWMALAFPKGPRGREREDNEEI